MLNESNRKPTKIMGRQIQCVLIKVNEVIFAK